MDNLIITALQECRIQGAERFIAFARHPGGKGHRMLLGNAHVKGTLWETIRKDINARARWHGGGNRRNFFVLLGQLDQRFAVHLGVAWRIRGWFGLLASDDVKLGNAMIFVRRTFGWAIALAFLRHRMDQDRAIHIRIAHVFKHRQKMIHIVTINRPDIEETHFFKQGPAGHHATGIFF